MADIVQTLRNLSDAVEAQQAPHNYVLHLRAGADEVERLRAGGCARDQGTTQYCAEAAKLAADNERLRAWNAEIALNARHFAEALREIAEHPTGGVGCNPEGFVKAARAALEGNNV